ncbi:MAG: hypothetical protein E7614_04020 [Ruminococcaceae bacterium]|nr:hypothetical protein [Oscillospiraceae bacterium]
MKENKPIAKGIFKRNKKVFFQNIITAMAFIFFALLFFELGIKLKKNEDAVWFFSFIACLFCFLFSGILAIKEAQFKLYSIELYDREIKLRDSLFKEKIIEYCDIVDVFSLNDGLMIVFKRKGVGVPHLSNNDEIAALIRQKINENKRQRIFDPEKEEINFKSKKRTLWLRTFFLCGTIILMFLAIFATMWATGCREMADFTPKDEKIFSVFVIVEILILVGLIVCSALIVRARYAYDDAKQRYSEALANALINKGIDERTVRVLRTNTGRVVIYRDEYLKAYKCSHEMFILKGQEWYSYMLSDSFQILDEVWEYLEDFEDEIIDL